MRKRLSVVWFAVPGSLVMACSGAPMRSAAGTEDNAGAAVARDAHSFADPARFRVRHLDLDLGVSFDRKVLSGAVVLTVERSVPGDESPLVLDTRDLVVSAVSASASGPAFEPVDFLLGQPDAVLGSPLTIRLPADAVRVRIEYETSPGASGLQWLEPAQTAGRQYPFMYTQSQAIHARSWIPLQDTPAVRVTYTARVRTPPLLGAVMSAVNHPDDPRDGDYHFEMGHPVPSYLIALAVGDIAFQAMSDRTGVYAEPGVLEAAAREFSDTEQMIIAAERLYGPYRWERYDLLVLPPSFPFGGMENPRLTFATPTVIAGDRSLVSLVAHELAHSWSGNLVTNATWRDFWLNEGFTTYIERRLVEEVYGRERAEMEAVLGRQVLDQQLATLSLHDQVLHLDLEGRDPDDALSEVPYEKGALFLRHLDETFGRERFDRFLREYFDRFAFQSLTTSEFEAYLRATLFEENPDAAARVALDSWLREPGLPDQALRSTADAFTRVEQESRKWLAGTPASRLQTAAWTTHEWLHFLRSLPDSLTHDQMAELDRAFNLTGAGNAEIAHQWLLMAIRNAYEPASGRLEDYLVSIGRRKLIRPLYEELVKTEEGRARARRIYARARPGYHPIAADTIDKIVDK